MNATKELLALQAWSNARWAEQVAMQEYGNPEVAKILNGGAQ